MLGPTQIASSVVHVVALLLFKPLELKANTIASFLSFVDYSMRLCMYNLIWFIILFLLSIYLVKFEHLLLKLTVAEKIRGTFELKNENYIG